MKNYNILLNVNLKQIYALPKDKKERNKVLVQYTALAIVVLGLLAGVCALLYYALQLMITAAGNTEFLPDIIGGCMTGVQFFVLVNGFISYMSVMFYSKDTQILMSMPLKPMTIYLSKFTVVYLTHVLTAALMLLPLLLVVGIAAKITSAAYYLISLLALLITPIIPLFIISLLALPMAYIVKFMRKHRALSIISVLVVFIGAFVAYFFLVMSLTKINTDMKEIASGLLNVFQIMGTIMYPNVILANSMLATDISILTNLSIYLAIIVGLAALSLGLSQLLYKHAVPKFSEVGVSSNGKKLKAVVKSNNVIPALIKSELKLICKDLTSVMNYILGIILTPIIVSIMIFSMNFVETPSDLTIMMYGLMMVMVFSIGANYLAIMPISREGKQYFYLKTLPIKPKDYLTSKVIMANAYSVTIIILVAIIFLIRGINPLNVLLYTISTTLLTTGVNALSMTRDICKPNFYWTNNKELFKQNSKSLVPMLISIGLMVSVIGMMTGHIFLGTIVAKIHADVIFWSVYFAIALAFFIIPHIRFYKKNTARLVGLE